MKKLPDYVAIKTLQEHIPVLHTPAQEMQFPLSAEDLEIISILEAKYDQEENCAGLAAVQIGFAKKVFVFAVPDDEELKKWRNDLSQSMPKSIWINPSYEGLGPDTTTDYEGCFSVIDLAAPVTRYTTIRYTAYTPDGTKLEGIATGFLARVIQHETDHLNGILFVNRANPEDVMTIEAYRTKRADSLKSEE